MMQDDDGVILIQGDSLPLPREGVPYIDTWPCKLRRETKNQYDVVNLSQSEKTTADLSPETRVHRMRQLEYYQAKKIVVQLGIVDCAPRYFRRSIGELLNLIPSRMISGGIFFITKKLRQRSSKRAYVSDVEFSQNLIEYLQRAYQLHTIDGVVFVKILSASQKYKQKNQYVGSAIHRYNDIIDQVASEFEFATSVRPLADSELEEQKIVDEMTVEDGYHLNADGHLRLYQRLHEILFENDIDR